MAYPDFFRVPMFKRISGFVLNFILKLAFFIDILPILID